MPRRARPLSVFMGLPQGTREVLRSQPAVSETEEEHPEVNRANLLSTQPPRRQPLDDILDVEQNNPRENGFVVHKDQAARPQPDASSSSGLPASSTTTSSAPDSVVTLRKRRASPIPTTTKRRKTHAWDVTGLVPRYTDASEVPAHLKKYFYQRHSLFPNYSRLPLLLDETGWYSVTPAVIARQIAERCRCDVILDAFCGVGGNAIAFARTCERVIAMDNDLTRLKIARHNALHCGVAHRIEFVLADYVEWARASPAGGTEAIDVVFLSPPWGGPEYLNFGGRYPLSAVEPVPGDELFRMTERITPNIAYFLPRNVDVEEVGALARPLEGSEVVEEEGREREWVEIEEEWVGDKLKAVTAYYGGLIQ